MKNQAERISRLKSMKFDTATGTVIMEPPVKTPKQTPVKQGIVFISLLDAIALLYGSGGKIFTVLFQRRSDLTFRRMQARIGVKKHLKGGKPSYNFAANKLISVYEVNNPDKKANGYKSIPWEGLREIAMGGKHYVVREVELKTLSVQDRKFLLA